MITERIIKIHTTATDKDGNKEIEAGKDVTIIDTVTLEAVSYTHLDVYKRQVPAGSGRTIGIYAGFRFLYGVYQCT